LSLVEVTDTAQATAAETASSPSSHPTSYPASPLETAGTAGPSSNPVTYLSNLSEFVGVAQATSARTGSAQQATYLSNLPEVIGAAEAQPARNPWPALPANSRKSPQGKDGAAKSDPKLRSTETVPVATAAVPPPLVRLLQFGLVIEPPSTEKVEGPAVERAGSSPSMDRADAEGAAAMPPNSQPSTGNLAFALRLTDSTPAASSHPSTANAQTETTPDSAESGAPDANGTSRNSASSSEPQRPDTTVSAPPAAVLSSPAPAVQIEPSGPAISQPAAQDIPPAAHTAPVSDPPEQPVAAPAQHISLSLADGQNQRVEVHLMDRAGEVRVSVRSADEGLTHSMRADLGSLTGKLNQSGYSTEQFAPAGADASSFSNRRQPSDGHESAAGNRQNPQQNQSGGQQPPPRDGRRQRPSWVDELENSLTSSAANRSNNPWQHRA
jgi:hypothetical protein